jgi:hypothetical protein
LLQRLGSPNIISFLIKGVAQFALLSNPFPFFSQCHEFSAKVEFDLEVPETWNGEQDEGRDSIQNTDALYSQEKEHGDEEQGIKQERIRQRVDEVPGLLRRDRFFIHECDVEPLTSTCHSSFRVCIHMSERGKERRQRPDQSLSDRNLPESLLFLAHYRASPIPTMMDTVGARAMLTNFIVASVFVMSQVSASNAAFHMV